MKHWSLSMLLACSLPVLADDPTEPYLPKHERMKLTFERVKSEVSFLHRYNKLKNFSMSKEELFNNSLAGIGLGNTCDQSLEEIKASDCVVELEDNSFRPETLIDGSYKFNQQKYFKSFDPLFNKFNDRILTQASLHYKRQKDIRQYERIVGQIYKKSDSDVSFYLEKDKSIGLSKFEIYHMQADLLKQMYAAGEITKDEGQEGMDMITNMIGLFFNGNFPDKLDWSKVVLLYPADYLDAPINRVKNRDRDLDLGLKVVRTPEGGGGISGVTIQRFKDIATGFVGGQVANRLGERAMDAIEGKLKTEYTRRENQVKAENERNARENERARRERSRCHNPHGPAFVPGDC